MAGVELKGSAIIVDDSRGARVINGRLRVRFVTRTGALRVGVGSAQIGDGIAAHNEARVINGALRVRLN